MADHTGIEWAEATWNPVVGCSLVSPGCTRCYAMRMAARIEAMGGKGGEKYRGLTQHSKAGAVWTGTVRMDDAALDQPLRWRRPRRIFVNSMSDLFHEGLLDEAIDKVFAVMALSPHHTFIVLTKRAARMQQYLAAAGKYERIYNQIFGGDIGDLKWRHPDVDASVAALDSLLADGFLPHVWLGVSIEDQARADERVPQLLATPAAVRIVSAEPLLGPIDLTSIDPTGEFRAMKANGWSAIWKNNGLGRAWLDGVIVGGESGPGARPMHPDWARSLRDQCTAAGVPFFFKQWGEWVPAIEGDDGVKFYMTADDGGDEFRFAEISPRPIHRFADRVMWRVGKRRAGRLLDGRTWDELPEVRHA